MPEYSKRRIPTVFAFVILLLGIIGGVIFAESSLNYISRPETKSNPRDIRIANVTSSMGTISWLTDEEVSGAIDYAPAGSLRKNIQEALDDRAAESTAKQFKTHHVTLRNLAPKTTYDFVIRSNNKSFDNDGKPFQFATFAREQFSDLEPASGKVVYVDKQPAQGALLYLQPAGAYPLSTVVRASGSWILPLNIAHSRETNLPLAADEVKLDIYVITPDGKQSQVVTSTKNDSPVPLIIAGEDFDFRQIARLPQKKAAVLGEQTAITILQPEEKQALTTQRPLIRGKGFPGQTVSIILESETQTGVVRVDLRGNWSWTPPQALPPGTHTITVKTTDAQGSPITLRRRFIVLRSGSRVLGEATPSATLAPSPTPTSIPAPTAITPTTVFDTPTPTATTTPVPVSGNLTPLLILIAAGALLIFLGLNPAFIRIN